MQAASESQSAGNDWQLRECWNGSSIDRVSGRRELLPSASEQILSPLRFQETRGGSGVCHFGFKDQVLSVPVDLARGPMGSSSPAVHHYHLRQLRRSLRRPSSSSDARPAALATSRTAEDPALPCSLPDPGPDCLVHGEREFDAIRAQLRAVEGVVAALQQRCDRAAATKEVVPWEMRRGAASLVGKPEHVGQASAAGKAESDDVPVVDSAAPAPETDGFASEHARTDEELHDECLEAPLCPAIVGPDLVPAALDVEAVDQGGVAEDSGRKRARARPCRQHPRLSRGAHISAPSGHQGRGRVRTDENDITNPGLVAPAGGSAPRIPRSSPLGARSRFKPCSFPRVPRVLLLTRPQRGGYREHPARRLAA